MKDIETIAGYLYMTKMLVFFISIMFLISTIFIPGQCTAMNKAGIANPASVNCINKGGSLSIQKRGDGGEYGICIFEDNRQCEEWAMFRGKCPVGGLRVAGYATPAAKICVITGGIYTATGNNKMDNEQGNCAFKNGTICNAWDYFNGKCIGTD
jgi:putative hemolysin